METKNKIKDSKTMKNKYTRKKLIKHLERYFDEWVTDGDWWSGTETFEVNVFSELEDGYFFNKDTYCVAVYGLKRNKNTGRLEVDTSNELDWFTIDLTEKVITLQQIIEYYEIDIDNCYLNQRDFCKDIYKLITNPEKEISKWEKKIEEYYGDRDVNPWGVG